MDAAEIRLEDLTPEEQAVRVARRTGIEGDDHVAAGDGQSPWWLPWQKLGTVLPGKMSVAEALDASHLAGWDLVKVPVAPLLPGGAIGAAIPQFSAVLRQRDHKALGVVKQRYQIISNEQAFDWAQYLLGDGEGDAGTHFTSAGSLRGGRIVFLVAKTPFDVDLPNDGKLETYLLVTNRHDGGGAVTCAVVTVRVVCANTLARSLSGALATFRIAHTRTAESKLGQAQHALGLARGAAERAEAMALKLLKERMGKKALENFLVKLLPDTEEMGKVERRRQDERRVVIADLYDTHPTTKFLPETAWRAYQAVSFYADHMTPRRDMGNDGSPEETRMAAVVGGVGLGERAAEILKGYRWK